MDELHRAKEIGEKSAEISVARELHNMAIPGAVNDTSNADGNADDNKDSNDNNADDDGDISRRGRMSSFGSQRFVVPDKLLVDHERDDIDMNMSQRPRRGTLTQSRRGSLVNIDPSEVPAKTPNYKLSLDEQEESTGVKRKLTKAGSQRMKEALAAEQESSGIRVLSPVEGSPISSPGSSTPTSGVGVASGSEASTNRMIMRMSSGSLKRAGSGVQKAMFKRIPSFLKMGSSRNMELNNGSMLGSNLGLESSRGKHVKEIKHLSEEEMFAVMVDEHLKGSESQLRRFIKKRADYLTFLKVSIPSAIYIYALRRAN